MRTKDEAKAYLEGLGKKAGLDENGLRALLANDEVLEDARNHLTRHDEMASGIDRARNEAKAELDRLNKWYSDVAEPTVAQATKLRAAHDRYKEQYGDLDGGGAPGGGGRAPNGQFVSKQDLDNTASAGIQVAKQIAWITSDYNARFGSKYGPISYEQVEEWEKFAVSRGRPPVESYREWVAPKEKELRDEAEAKRNQDFQSQLKAAREEGIREGQTKRQWDSASTRKNTDQFGRDPEAVKLGKTDAAAADEAGDKAFIDAWDQWETAHAGDVR